jgi:hypothetical protein
LAKNKWLKQNPLNIVIIYSIQVGALKILSKYGLPFSERTLTCTFYCGVYCVEKIRHYVTTIERQIVTRNNEHVQFYAARYNGQIINIDWKTEILVKS